MRKWLIGSLAAVVLMTGAAPALARTQEDEETALKEGRLEGYGEVVALPSAGSGLLWMMFMLMSVVMIAVLFKNAKRSHLD